MSQKSASFVFAQRLRALMERRGLTQPELAKKTGGRVGQTTISLYLNPGRRAGTAKGSQGSPTLEKVEQVADALAVPWVSLLVDQEGQTMTEWPFEGFIKPERWRELSDEERRQVIGAAVDKMMELLSQRGASGKQPATAA